MGELAQQLAITAGIFGVWLVGPGLAFALMLQRKRRARAARRSPIGIDLLRGPGHTLREQIDEAVHDVATELNVLSFLPLIMLSLFLALAVARGLPAMVHLAPSFVAITVVVIAWTLRKLLKAGARLDNLKNGFDAELAVGQELDQLMRQGAAVFHDVPAEGFNIDHVVIAAEGVFAVETKGFTKPRRGQGRADATVVFDGKTLRFPTWTTADPLEQAQRQAAWLSKWLASAVGEPIPVLPIVALPGWFVELAGRGEVKVFSGKQLAGLLKAHAPGAR